MTLAFDFGNDLIAVFIAFVECAEDNGIDVPADKIGADRLFFFLFACRKIYFGRILLVHKFLLFNISP